MRHNYWRDISVDAPPREQVLADGQRCGVPSCIPRGRRVKNVWGVCNRCSGQPIEVDRIGTEADRQRENELLLDQRDDL